MTCRDPMTCFILLLQLLFIVCFSTDVEIGPKPLEFSAYLSVHVRVSNDVMGHKHAL